MVNRCCVLFLTVWAFSRSVSTQGILQKNAQVVDASADPDVVEITVGLSSPVTAPNSNLSDITNQLLIVGQVQTTGNLISQQSDVIDINFVSNIPADQIILSYNATLPDRGDGLTDAINLTSTLTYFTSVNGTITTNIATATICLGKKDNVVVREEVQQWYIAVVLILCLILGFALVLLILWLIQHFCKCGPFGGASHNKIEVEQDGEKIQTQSANSSLDVSNAIATDDPTETRHLLEIIEINDIAMIEIHVQSERAAILEILFETNLANLEPSDRRRTISELKLEIKKEIEQALQENKESREKVKKLNNQKRKEIHMKHETEIEKLKEQVVNQTPEVQNEFLSLANERHKLETKAEEYIALLRLKQRERNANDANDVRCKILCEKLDAFFDKNEDYRLEIKESFTILLEKGNKILEKQFDNLQSAKNRREIDINKIKSSTLETRRSWNSFGQALINSIKTICRELQLETEIRKSLTSFVREELVKVKTFFDHEMVKERADYLKLCANEKAKINKRPKTNFNSRGLHEDPVSWMEENIQKIQSEIAKNTSSQEQYEKFAVDTWNKKIEVVLKSTHEKLDNLKAEIVKRLGQNGASRKSVEEFIADETADLKTNDPDDVSVPILRHHGDLNSKMEARQIILRCHDEVLRDFHESQVFVTSKNSEDISTLIQKPQLQNAKLSQQNIRQLIEYYTDMVERKNKIPKQKRQKSYMTMNEKNLRTRLEMQLENWRTQEERQLSNFNSASIEQFRSDMLSTEENLTKAVSAELAAQIEKNSKLDLLNLDLNALERIMMTLLQLLVSERKLSPAECNVVLQEHRNQADELKRLSSQRMRRRLEQVVRKRFQTPPSRPHTEEEHTKDVAASQVIHYLDMTRSISEKAKQKIRGNSDAAREKYEVLLQLYEQQATELRELNLKVIQALVKVAKITSNEMNACLTLLLHHRQLDEVRAMVNFIYSGVKDVTDENSTLLPVVRSMISQQKHRLAENLLRNDEDFGRTPIRSTSNKLQKIKQPHRVTFSMEDTPPLRRERLSPLPGIRPEPVGRTSSPVSETVGDYQSQSNTVYSNFDQPKKQTRRRKKKSLKSLAAPR